MPIQRMVGYEANWVKGFPARFVGSTYTEIPLESLAEACFGVHLEAAVNGSWDNRFS